MNEKEALKILGLDENSSKEKIDKRYFLLSKRYCTTTDSEDNSYDKARDVNEAYKVLEQKYIEQEREKYKLNIPILRKLNIDADKSDNFIFYHRYIIGIIAIVLCMSAFALYKYLSRPDFVIVYNISVNKYKLDQSKDHIMQKIKEMSPEISRPECMVYTQSADYRSLPAFIADKKSEDYLKEVSKKADIYILSEQKFSMLAANKYLAPLDGILDSNFITYNSEKLITLKDKNGEEHIYGIKLSDSFLTNNITYELGILSMPLKTQDSKLCAKVFKDIVSYD